MPLRHNPPYLSKPGYYIRKHLGILSEKIDNGAPYDYLDADVLADDGPFFLDGLTCTGLLGTPSCNVIIDKEIRYDIIVKWVVFNQNGPDIYAYWLMKCNGAIDSSVDLTIGQGEVTIRIDEELENA